MTKVQSSRDKKKTLPISVAFNLAYDAEGNDVIAQALPGRTFVYFPAEKEVSGLRFHINGPFSATVARDSIRDCEENATLMEEVADLVAKSLVDIKKKGLMTISFYGVLPNAEDMLGKMYLPIRNRIVDEFQKKRYLLAKSGGYISADGAIMGPRAYADLLDDRLLLGFVGQQRMWIQNPQLKTSRESKFIESVGVMVFSDALFIESFCAEEGRRYLLKEAQTRNKEWLKRLYNTIASIYANLENEKKLAHYDWKKHAAIDKQRKSFDAALRASAIVRCADKEMRRPGEVYVLPSNMNPRTVPEPVIMPYFVAEKERTRVYDPKSIIDCFVKLGMREYNFQVVIDRMCEKWYGRTPLLADGQFSEGYIEDIRSIVAAYMRGEKVAYGSASLFAVEDEKGFVSLVAPSEVFIGSDYGNPGGDEVARFCHKARLAPQYKAVFKAKERNALLELLRKYGAQSSLEIVPWPIERNPSFEELSVGVANETVRCVKEDYCATGFPESLSNVSKSMAKQIWKLLVDNDLNAHFAIATYQANARSATCTCDSSLIAYLKSNAWIPNRSGKKCRPGEIAFEDVDPTLAGLGKGSLIEALEFGSEASAQRKAEKKLEQDAKELGCYVISKEDYDALQEYKKAQRKAARKMAKKEPSSTIQSLFDKQNRDAQVDDEVVFLETGAVANPERRAAKVRESITEAVQRPVQVRTRVSTIRDASSPAEHESLKQWYAGACQICDTSIVKSDGSPYFEAVNIVKTSDLDEGMMATVGVCWNSLSLCPNCSARYRFGVKNISSLPSQIRSHAVEARSSDRINLEIELSGKTVTIGFAPKHFLAVRQGLEVLEERLCVGEDGVK